MYFSQNAIVLVMLLFVISTIYYTTIDYKTKAVEDEIKIKEFSLYEKNIKNTVDRNINKIVEDAFINASYKIMKEKKFFKNSDEAVSYITSCIKNETNKTLSCLIQNSSNVTFEIDDITLSPTDDPLKIHISGSIKIEYKKKLNNGEIVGGKDIPINKDVKLSRIPDPYVYVNKFYYKWNKAVTVTLNGNDINDGKYHTFCIILNRSNFHYEHMHNPDSPTELRVVGYNPTVRWNVLLPYWVQTWREGDNEVSVIWVKVKKDELFNGNQLKIVYNSTTPVDKQNPDNTFTFFDDFNYFNPDKWSSVGYFIINNSKITVIAGAGSSVYTKDNYDPGYELIFRANFTQAHSQAVGFFTIQSVENGVGWACYEWDARWLYMRNDTETHWGDNWVNNGVNYLNKFYIYDLKREANMLRFKILNDTFNVEYQEKNFSTNLNTQYPISINALPPYGSTSNTNVTVDWIFLKDINNIEVANIGEEEDIEYKEEKPKTFTGTIYYGEQGKYILVYNSTYSIIGLFTNKTDYWYSPTAPGYKPLIEEN